jgi:hypothetical protein
MAVRRSGCLMRSPWAMLRTGHGAVPPRSTRPFASRTQQSGREGWRAAGRGGGEGGGAGPRGPQQAHQEDNNTAYAGTTTPPLAADRASGHWTGRDRDGGAPLPPPPVYHTTTYQNKLKNCQLNMDLPLFDEFAPPAQVRLPPARPGRPLKTDR